MAILRDWFDRWRADLPRRERGQGLMEYGLIISVVSIAAVVLIMAMGPRVASMFSTAGASAFPSDRRRKGNFARVDTGNVLTRVMSLPVQTWNYLGRDPQVRHIGPMAQDFHRAFGTGNDEVSIALVDANGVALAAIQGLHDCLQRQGGQIAAVEARLTAIEAATCAETADREALSTP
jgi:Flp pilus assembly pilin Flp